jgi:ribonuclease HI
MTELLRLLEAASRTERAANRAEAKSARREALRALRQARHDGPATAWRAWFDGSARPNPGRCTIGCLLKGPDGEVVEISRAAGYGNSGEAEYMALIALLETAVQNGAHGLTIYGDSQVVVNDVNGPEHAGAPALQAYRRKAGALLAQLREVTLRWVPRHKNLEADALSQRTAPDPLQEQTDDILPD